VNNREEKITIKPRQENRSVLVIAVLVLPFFMYRRFLQAEQHQGEWFYWYSFGFLTLLWLFGISMLVFKNKYAERMALTLTPEGFLKGSTLYRWHEIDYFGIANAYDGTCSSLVFIRKTIYWNYRISSTYKTASQRIRSLIFGFDDSVYASYEIDAGTVA
jgi:hypothetical protein